MYFPFLVSHSVIERPSHKPDTQLGSFLNFLCLSLQLVHVPVAPQELALEEPGLGACKPEVEARGQRN